MEACTFRPHGSAAFDDRVLRWYVSKSEVSLWTVQGRLRLPFVTGPHQKRLLQSRQGESDLVFQNGKWFLLAVCEVEDPPLREVDGFLGVDLGLVQLATDSEGNAYTGGDCMALRRRVAEHRRKLQKRGTKNAKRRFDGAGDLTIERVYFDNASLIAQMRGEDDAPRGIGL